jgi:hypothetical protein
LSDTLPALSDEEFERRATHREPNWWAGGEQLIYVPEVMSLEGWRDYGGPDNMRLTQAQCDLMIWSDIVGQVANGGIAQFFDNYGQILEQVSETITRLGWPELLRNYQAAASQYIQVNGKPVTPKKWREEAEKQWERNREEARRLQRKRGLEPATGIDLDRSVMRMQSMGLIKMPPARVFPAVDAFDDWFFSDETRRNSERYISDFIRRRRDELVNIKGETK